MSFYEASRTVQSRRTKSTLRGLAVEDERRRSIAEANRASWSERELAKKVKVTPPKSLFSDGQFVLDPSEEAMYMKQLEDLLSPIHTKDEARPTVDRIKGYVRIPHVPEQRLCIPHQCTSEHIRGYIDYYDGSIW